MPSPVEPVHNPAMTRSALLPTMFVLLWCTGYLVVPVAMADAGPVRFLALRFGSAAALLAVAAVVLHAPWARRRIDYAHMAVVGLLLHGVGLGGVWVALDLGVETGVAALVMGTQPLITAALAVGFIGERIDRRAAAGLGVGFLGVTLVIHHKLSGVGDPAGLAAVVVAVVAMTLGMLYQKRRCAHVDLVTSTTVQLSFAAVGAFTVAWWIDDRPIEWTARIFATLGWSVLVLSIGATIVLYMLLRPGRRVAGREPSLPRSAPHRGDGLGRLRGGPGTAHHRRHGPHRDRRRARGRARRAGAGPESVHTDPGPVASGVRSDLAPNRAGADNDATAEENTMNAKELRESAANAEPPEGLSPALAALWRLARGEWDAAHGLAQSDRGRDGAWVHAHLHRVEGDLANAGYWYRRAGRPASEAPLEDEWEEIATSLLAARG